MTSYREREDFKSSLRRELRNRRLELSAAVRADYDRAIRRHLLQLIKKHAAHSIAAFWPFNGEPDITPLFEPLMTAGHQLCLPVVAGGDDHGMHFQAWRQGVELIPNRYGIPEPRGTAAVALRDIDLLAMPLVGYDHRGNRLGMGGGYYDRHLDLLRDSPAPLRAGIAYSLQEVDALEDNSWDIPLHAIVNERGWFTFVRDL